MKAKVRKKKRPLFYINGVKGAISLFLAVLMTPFLTIAIALVETGRYNSAVSILDEVLGVTSVSTLANYDGYLQNRWGLLAMAQDINIDTVYSQYLDTNSSVMGSALNIRDVNASGQYPLSNPAILEEQLMEYCKLNAPTKLSSEIVSKALSLTKLMEQLKKLKNLENVASLLTKGVSALDAGITMVESAEELKETAKALDELKTEYNTNYTAFETAMNTLISNLELRKEKSSDPRLDELDSLEYELAELNDQLKKLKEDNASNSAIKSCEMDIEAKEEAIAALKEELTSLTDEIEELNKTISSNRTAAASAKTSYATTLSEISEKLTEFRDQMASCEEAVQQLQENVAGVVSDALTVATDIEKKRTDLAEKEKDLNALRESVENWDGAEDDPAYIAGVEMLVSYEEEVSRLQTEIGELEVAQAVASAGEKGIGKMADGWEESCDNYTKATINQVIEGFKALHKKVNDLNVSNVTADTAKVSPDVYKKVALKGYIAEDKIQEYLDTQEKELKEGSLKAMLDGLIAIYNQLMGMSIFYEAKLNSNINMAYYTENLGGLPGGASADNPILSIMSSIGSFCKEGADLRTNLASFKYLELLNNLKSMAEDLISLFENIGKAIKNFLVNINELLTSHEKWYTTTYCTYNLACRTDFSDANNSTSFKTMTGYGVGKESFDEASGLPGLPVFGEITALIDTILVNLNKTGEDIMFTGAELEYLMFGSTSELANQLYVFAVIYFIRMLSSIPAIMADAEVQSLAAAATLGYPVVIALYILLEPLAQTVLLVNGKTQPLIPNEVYLSPTGLPKLVKELLWFCELTATESEALSNKLVDTIAKSRGDYDYQTKLNEYDPSDQSIEFSLKFSYRDYCLVVLLLTVTKEQQIARLSNLIQMETLCYYKNKKKGYTFDLRESYTYLYAQVNASVNQVMPSLLDSSLFAVKRDHYRGY